MLLIIQGPNKNFLFQKQIDLIVQGLCNSFTDSAVILFIKFLLLKLGGVLPSDMGIKIWEFVEINMMRSQPHIASKANLRKVKEELVLDLADK